MDCFRSSKYNILDLSYIELTELVQSLGEAKFRAGQIFSWLSKGVSDFDMMSNVPGKLRAALGESYCIGLPEIVRDQHSQTDGTRKCLMRLSDGGCIESVFMKYSYGNSICISSQLGCRMGCSFCASTLGGLERSLTAGEMLGQILAMRNLCGEDIGHVVVMGIGEPFDNYDNLCKFMRIINDPKGYGLGLRNITVSTCGLIPRIESWSHDFPQVNLAVSLHAPNDAVRRKLMPIARKYGYSELIDTCRRYTEATGRRITFEYALIRDVNDSDAAAKELAAQLKGWLAHVNLIPLNDVNERSYKASYYERIKSFKGILEASGVPVTVRRTLGSDIDAACGQLRNSVTN